MMANAYSVCKEFQIFIESPMEKFRAETFETKEPETVSWIRRYVKNGDTFLDVGSNIGIYSLFLAGRYSKSFVLAFEPYLPNFLRLEENIQLNGFKNIRAFHAAFGVHSRMENFYVPKIEVGSSGGQIEKAVDERGKKFNFLSWERVPVYRMDDFFIMLKIPPPNHIKIDVDGQEEKVIIGGMNTIGNYGCRSILIERNPSLKRELLVGLMEKLGYTTKNEFNKMKNHSRVRRAKEGIEAENIIFTRRI